MTHHRSLTQWKFFILVIKKLYQQLFVTFLLLYRSQTRACGPTSTPTNTQKLRNHRRRTGGRTSGRESATGKEKRRGHGQKRACRKRRPRRGRRAGPSCLQRSTAEEARRLAPPTCSSPPPWLSTRATCPTCTDLMPTAMATSQATLATEACPQS